MTARPWPEVKAHRELRDRITAILKRQFGVLASHHDADELITELTLRAEVSYGTNYPHAPIEDRRLVRYVTDWRVDQ